jgi:uncharacterized repeat protein (TIGR03803 family)
VLYDFCSKANCADGFQPFGGLVEDASGNLYGTTYQGGSGSACLPLGCGGAVFKLDSAGIYTILHNLCSEANCADGWSTYATLIRDGSGNLYGTTLRGGAHHTDPNGNGGGVVFKLDAASNYTVLYSFCSQANCTDGYLPYAGVIEDASGNLYGTTTSGGANGHGTVFKLDSVGNYTVLHSFCSQTNCADGGIPETGLTIDASSNLYGTATTGGANGYGTLFKLGSGGNYTVLHSFCSQANCADGGVPLSSPTIDASGSLYGTTLEGGGPYSGGVAFKLNSAGVFSVLHEFCILGGACMDGGSPRSLIEDAAGNLYGTTSGGGAEAGAGTVFKLDSAGNYSNVYFFCSQLNCTDGYLPIINPPVPLGNLIEDSSGNLYGTASSGGLAITGSNGQTSGGLTGVIFKLPSSATSSAGFTLGLNPPSLTFGSLNGVVDEVGAATLTVMPTGGFNQTITFACSGLPSGATCTFSPSTLTPTDSAAWVALDITATGTGTSTATQHQRPAQTPGLFLAMLAPFLFLRWPKSRVKMFKRAADATLLMLALVPLLSLNACGGGSSSGGGSSGGGRTPAGTYTVTVTGTAPSLSTSTTLTFVVQ